MTALSLPTLERAANVLRYHIAQADLAVAQDDSLESGAVVDRIAQVQSADRAAYDEITAYLATLSGKAGCAACDRGDFQLGHADGCPKTGTP